MALFTLAVTGICFHLYSKRPEVARPERIYSRIVSWICTLASGATAVTQIF